MERQIAVVTATSLEAHAARRALPGAAVFEAGIALAKGHADWGTIVVSCGLAGALRPGIPSGTVLVPAEIERPDGTRVRCDPEIFSALVVAARRLGYEPLCDPLLTSSALVRGPERERLARGGCAGVDMESGLLRAPRVAVVRVVLDTPERELRADWLQPARALRDPRNWPEAVWLATVAPRYARRAAAVIAAASLQDGDAQRGDEPR
jgi:hypothetical protein